MKLATGTLGLIIANAIFFIIAYVLPGNSNFMVGSFGLFFPKNDHFQIWQIVTTMFMHGGTLHLFFNMFALYTFGMVLEARWGMRRFLTFYFAAGIGASLIYTLVNLYQFGGVENALLDRGISATEIQRFLDTSHPTSSILNVVDREELKEFYNIYHTPAVGASGAIYGILVAFGMMFPNTKLMLIFLPVPIAAKYFIPCLLLLDLFSGVTGFSLFGGGIAHFAHIGGAIIGFLLMSYWRLTLSPRRQ